jgi:D-sedoheptulose 7-phosphate isomerase
MSGDDRGARFVRDYLRGSAEAKARAAASDGCAAALAAIARAMASALAAGRKILICGNGGSAADSQHMATELVVRLTAERARRALPAIALSTDTSLLTACSNDFSFDEVFARQVEALGERGDVLLGISTSGGSRNVIRAFEVAAARGLVRVLFTGGTGGRLLPLADHAFVAPAGDTSRIQECHQAGYHAVCFLVEELLFGAEAAPGAQHAERGQAPG